MKVSKTREYRSWEEMKARCNRPTHHAYSRYGGRGIVVCDRWNSFENFFADMGARPDGTSIDRVDNDGNYEPANCRWAASATQNGNRSICMPAADEAAVLTGIQNRLSYQQIAALTGRTPESIRSWARRKGLRSGWPSSTHNAAARAVSPHAQENDRG